MATINTATPIHLSTFCATLCHHRLVPRPQVMVPAVHQLNSAPAATYRHRQGRHAPCIPLLAACAPWVVALLAAHVQSSLVPPTVSKVNRHTLAASLVVVSIDAPYPYIGHTADPPGAVACVNGKWADPVRSSLYFCTTDAIGRIQIGGQCRSPGPLSSGTAQGASSTCEDSFGGGDICTFL